MTDIMRFTMSDTIAGYVVSHDEDENCFILRTTDGRECPVYLTSNTFASTIRNFGEDYRDVTGQLADMLYPGRVSCSPTASTTRSAAGTLRGEVDRVPRYAR